MSAGSVGPVGPVGPVGVVGLGAMGLRLAVGLHEAGTVVAAYDAVTAVRQRAAEAGVPVVDGLAGVASCPVVVLSLPTPEVVLSVVRELAGLGSPTVLDTSTIGPDTAREAAAVLSEAGGRYADCPVLGRPASVGSWTVPVGGADELVEVAREVLRPVTSAVVGVGPIGAAATAKVLNNLMLGTINAVTAELLVLAEAAGLDPGAWVDLVAGSGAASVSPMFRDIAARAVDGDFDPTFTVALMAKDNALALELASSLGVPVATGRAAHSVTVAALESGLGAEDSIAVVKPLEAATGLRARRHGG